MRSATFSAAGAIFSRCRRAVTDLAIGIDAHRAWRHHALGLNAQPPIVDRNRGPSTRSPSWKLTEGNH
jgi:hypothetical protein